MESTLTKFNDDNFFTWQSKTMYLLMQKSLWNLIVGDSTTVFTAQDNHKALGLIAQSLGDDVISHIAGIMDAKEAWNALNREFGTASKSSKTNLLMQFYKLKKKDDETLIAHLNKFKALKQQLLGVQKQIPDDEAIAVLLNSVNKAPFDTLVSTLQNIENTLDKVVSALLEYDSKHRPKSEEEIQVTTGFSRRQEVINFPGKEQAIIDKVRGLPLGKRLLSKAEELLDFDHGLGGCVVGVLHPLLWEFCGHIDSYRRAVEMLAIASYGSFCMVHLL
ncbi:hypothetical protein L7F22_058954 [Adiantum nelumboides]|nr:hypothetical protein [Adiantum nelumboides]